MGNLVVLFIHSIAAMARLLGPDGVRPVVPTENPIQRFPPM
jgi:hypothetical protein